MRNLFEKKRSPEEKAVPPSRYNLIDTIKEEDTIRTNEESSFVSYNGQMNKTGRRMLSQLQGQSIEEEESFQSKGSKQSRRKERFSSTPVQFF